MDYSKLGYLNVASAIPSVKVGDCMYNAQEIVKLVKKAQENEVEVISFPELSICGYTCADLFANTTLRENSLKALEYLASSLEGRNIEWIVGCPIEVNEVLYNCAVVGLGNKIIGVVPKSYLPSYKEFYEHRWFGTWDSDEVIPIRVCDGQWAPFGKNLHFKIADSPNSLKTISTFGVEICEDVWSPIPPSSMLALNGADIIFNISASNDLIGKNDYLQELLKQQSARLICGYVYSSCGFGESTTDVVFGGNAYILENGHMIAQSKRFSIDPQIVCGSIDLNAIQNDRLVNTTFRKSIKEHQVKDRHFGSAALCLRQKHLLRHYKKTPFVPSDVNDMKKRFDEITSIQAMGLAKRLVHIGTPKAVIGVSGGLDSTLALLVCDKAMSILNRPKSDIIGVTMPCFGTTERTYGNAHRLMEAIGTTVLDIDIKDSVLQHFLDIGHDAAKYDVTYENCQARERTQVLMDIANERGGLVIGTGDLSELALGWCTYNADHMSMYNVNVSIPKTLVRSLTEMFMVTTENEELRTVLKDILNTPISPELLPTDKDGGLQQLTENSVGPYILHDFFLYHFLRNNFSVTKILALAEAAFVKDGDFSIDRVKEVMKIFVKRFFSQQFKRNCLPDGPKVGSVSLSPRGDWRMPSDAASTIWIAEIDAYGK